MSEFSGILSQVAAGNRAAASQLLPLVYDELRKLASARLSREQPGQTLQATALVHEAYLRLVGDGDDEPDWENRAHFFAAAAESMRRILIEAARRKKRRKRGGDRVRQAVSIEEVASLEPREDLLALDAALEKLATVDQTAAELVQLRYFGGLKLAEAARVLRLPRRSADRCWAYARAWLHRELAERVNPED